jgi:hypothetical protein
MELSVNRQVIFKIIIVIARQGLQVRYNRKILHL